MPGPRFDPHSCGPFSGFAGPLADALIPPVLDLERLDIAEIKRRFAAGTLTSAQLVKAYLDRIWFVNQEGPGINAVRAVNPRRPAPRSPPTRRVPPARPAGRWPASRCWSATRSTSPACRRPPARSRSRRRPGAGRRARHELKAAGAIILGKVNVTELNGMVANGMPAGYGSLHGQALNPYDMRS